MAGVQKSKFSRPDELYLSPTARRHDPTSGRLEIARCPPRRRLSRNPSRSGATGEKSEVRSQKSETAAQMETELFAVPEKSSATVAENSALRTPQSPIEKAVAFAALRERALACVKCPHLASSRKTVVFGVGSIDAQLMFVGEAPGADEDEQGEPFVGKAGQLLTKIIQATGLS